MPSSTSSSENNAVMSKYDRALPGDSIGRAALIGLLVMIVMMSGWELYWRVDESTPSYRNSEGLWAIQRRRVNEIDGDKTVLAGSSRMYFNTQLDVWEQESGERPIQLSLEGTSPVSLMEDLAEDPDMTGTLIVGVAGEMFFTGFEYRGSAFERFAKETPSQWLGQQLSMLVEPFLAFYQYDYGLFTVIKRQPFPRREGVFFEMDVRRLANYGKDRNARLYSKVETDTEYAELAKEIWAQFYRPIDELSEEERAEGLENHNKQIDRAVAATKKLQERGVEVIFVRHPFEGVYDIIEPMYFPRAGGWDVLIERTGALGVHWQDHEELQGYWLPESSHLAADDAEAEPDFIGYDAAGPDVVRDQVAKEFRDEHRSVQAYADQLRAAGIDTSARLIQGPIVETVCREAKRFESDMLIVGSHGFGAIYDLLIGSISRGILKDTDIPVLVVPIRDPSLRP